MRNTVLSYLLLPLFAGLSFSLSAAPNAGAAPVELVSTSVVTQQPVSEQSAKTNLNTADAQTLQRELTGIGRAKAEAIVAYREAHGAFTSMDEILEVKGIGTALLDRNRGKLTLE